MLSTELKEDYHMSVKKAIVDFVLKDPRVQINHGVSREQVIVSIRSSTPTWKSSFIEAKKSISELFMKNDSVILSIFQIWESNNFCLFLFIEFKSTRLFDMESFVGKVGPFELRSFKAMMLQKFESSHEKLMTA